MAKQMKRIEKRYVPQQESYRNLPGLRPAADPVLAAETPVVDPAASKLKEMADAFSGINKALKDFYTMEKSFEETNIATNKTRALMGLPPVEGKGFLKYGSRPGYTQGLGEARGILIKNQLKSELANKNYFVDPESPDPEATKMQLFNFTQEFFDKQLGDLAKDPAFMEGAGKAMAQARVEAMVIAQSAVEEALDVQQANNFKIIAMDYFGERLPGVIGNPHAIRQLMREATRNSEVYGLHQDAANELLITSFFDERQNAYREADASGDDVAMESIMKELRSFTTAMELPDDAGIVPGGVSKEPGTGKIEARLGSTFKEMRQAYGTMERDHQVTLKNRREVREHQNTANIIYRFSRGEASQSELVSELNESDMRLTDPENYVKLIKMTTNLRNDIDSPVFQETLSSMLKNPQLNYAQVYAAYDDGRIDGQAMTRALDFVAKMKSMESEVRERQAHYKRINGELSREVEAKLKTTNELTIRKYILDNNVPEGAQQSFLLGYKDLGFVVDNDYLFNIHDKMMTNEGYREVAEQQFKKAKEEEAERKKLEEEERKATKIEEKKAEEAALELSVQSIADQVYDGKISKAQKTYLEMMFKEGNTESFQPGSPQLSELRNYNDWLASKVLESKVPFTQMLTDANFQYEMNLRFPWTPEEIRIKSRELKKLGR
jgi:hypothetical protein